MSRLLLSKVNTFQNLATTKVVLVAKNGAKAAAPMIDLAADDHSHHDAIDLPNRFTPSTSSSFNCLLTGGSLRVANSFTSKYF